MLLQKDGETALSRVLIIRGTPERQVLVRIGIPRRQSDSLDYSCPYQIVGLGEEKILWAWGVDGIQSLNIALQQIGAMLYSSSEWKNKNLYWLDDQSQDLGFPVPT